MSFNLDKLNRRISPQRKALCAYLWDFRKTIFTPPCCAAREAERSAALGYLNNALGQRVDEARTRYHASLRDESATDEVKENLYIRRRLYELAHELLTTASEKIKPRGRRRDVFDGISPRKLTPARILDAASYRLTPGVLTSALQAVDRFIDEHA